MRLAGQLWLRPNRANLIAALILAASAGFALWGLEKAYASQHRGGKRDDVRTALAEVRNLVIARQQRAGNEATALASSRLVQDAFALRDAGRLRTIVQHAPTVSFRLWNGKTIGRVSPQGISPSIGVYGTSGLLGRVSVDAEPTDALLKQARASVPAARLAYTVGGTVVASSPGLARGSLASALRGAVSEDIELGQDTSRPARVYGYAPTASVPVELLWPLLLAVVVGLGAFRVLERREARRRAEPPPNTVRDAVAMVGETLAATHNPDALLPVILRASVEATHAIGGTITSDGRRVASRGMVDGPDLETIDIELDVADGTPTTMTLYAPPLGFGPDARDAAAWIAGQAFIALENARLHGLVQRQAVTDDLTGLANRRRFLSQLEAEIVRSGRSGSPLGVVLADLDDFKRINDTWGHDVGDETLRRFAQILRATVRDVDLPVRLGGEEFAILLPETDLEGSAQLAERVRLALEEEDVVTSRATFRLTASFGVSCFPLAATADDVLTDADRRLYDAKRSGKNRVVVSTPFPSGHAS